MHIFGSMKELPQPFNNSISSIVVLNGRWKVYDDVNFQKQIGSEFTVGMYSFNEKIDTGKLEKLLKNEKEFHISNDMREHLEKQLKSTEKIENSFNDIISSIELVGMW